MLAAQKKNVIHINVQIVGVLEGVKINDSQIISNLLLWEKWFLNIYLGSLIS